MGVGRIRIPCFVPPANPTPGVGLSESSVHSARVHTLTVNLRSVVEHYITLRVFSLKYSSVKLNVRKKKETKKSCKSFNKLYRHLIEKNSNLLIWGKISRLPLNNSNIPFFASILLLSC